MGGEEGGRYRYTPHGRKRPPAEHGADPASKAQTPRNAAPADTPQSELAALDIRVLGAGGEVPLTVDADESYTLDIMPTKAIIVAATQWGAMRALETFSQTIFCRGAVPLSRQQRQRQRQQQHSHGNPGTRQAQPEQRGGQASCSYMIQNVPLQIADEPR